MNMNRWIILALLLFCAVPLARAADAPPQSQQGASVQVMEDFQRQQELQGANRKLTDQNKRKIMFFLGVPLLILLLITAGLGISMAVYGKQVFMAHMIFAALSVTLALVHVIVGLVWFYPF